MTARPIWSARRELATRSELATRDGLAVRDGLTIRDGLTTRDGLATRDRLAALRRMEQEHGDVAEAELVRRAAHVGPGNTDETQPLELGGGGRILR
jgi:hypothetical protein